MDDFLSGARDVALAAKLAKDVQQIMSMAGFDLTKCFATNEKVLNTISEDCQSKRVKEILLENKIPYWKSSGRSAEDAFYFIVDVSDKLLNKRMFLSITNSLCDALGFLVPVVLKAWLLYRHVCQEKQDWDKPITSSVRKQWKCCCGNLNNLRDIPIPRCYIYEGETLGMQSHVF